MTLSQHPYQLYNFFLCWNVIVVLAFQEKKKLCAYFLVSKFTQLRPQLPSGSGLSGKVTFSVSISCIGTVFSQNNVILSNWRACYCLNKIQTYYVPPFLKDSSPFGALFKNYDVKVVLKFHCYMYNMYIKWLLFVCHYNSKLQIQGLCRPLTTRP